MKPHKYAELIKAWADGAEIEVKLMNGEWIDWESKCSPTWTDEEYRIKPEPKPDVVRYIGRCAGGFWRESLDPPALADNRIKVVWDGETGELKSAEVLK